MMNIWTKETGRNITTTGGRDRAYNTYKGVRNSYKYEGDTLLRVPRRRWDDIKMDLKEVGYVGVEWIQLAQNRKQ
jgi:hypothetical protein